MKRIILIMTGLILFGAQVASANHLFYMTIKGQKQGLIKGDGIGRMWLDKISGDGYTYSVISPRDPQSGMPTGQRMHKPLVVIKEVNKSSPLLANAIFTNENLLTVNLEFPKTDASGVETVFYKITLTNANIAELHQFLTADGKLMEEIAFTFEKIDMTNVSGAITAGDNWETRVQ